MPSKAGAVDEDVVRTRAYLLWEADGRPEGAAEHYWGLAQAEEMAAAAGRLQSTSKQKRADAATPAREKKPKSAKAGGRKAGKRKG